MRNSIERLFAAITAARLRDPAESRTAQLLQSGRAKIAKKLAEEAIEVVIDAIQGQRDAVTRESADLVYHLVVLWVASGVRPADVWNEMARRERLFGIAEKLPKHAAKGPALPGDRAGSAPRAQALTRHPFGRALLGSKGRCPRVGSHATRLPEAAVCCARCKSIPRRISCTHRRRLRCPSQAGRPGSTERKSGRPRIAGKE
jgi:phosphoribosyl-ATP pyrophosphohydrolase